MDYTISAWNGRAYEIIHRVPLELDDDSYDLVTGPLYAADFGGNVGEDYVVEIRDADDHPVHAQEHRAL